MTLQHAVHHAVTTNTRTVGLLAAAGQGREAAHLMVWASEAAASLFEGVSAASWPITQETAATSHERRAWNVGDDARLLRRYNEGAVLGPTAVCGLVDQGLMQFAEDDGRPMLTALGVALLEIR